MNEKDITDKTDWASLKKMTDQDIALAAQSDPDAPLLSEYELSQFKRVHPVQEVDVREIRTKLQLSQENFAFFLGLVNAQFRSGNSIGNAPMRRLETSYGLSNTRLMLFSGHLRNKLPIHNQRILRVTPK